MPSLDLDGQTLGCGGAIAHAAAAVDRRSACARPQLRERGQGGRQLERRRRASGRAGTAELAGRRRALLAAQRPAGEDHVEWLRDWDGDPPRQAHRARPVDDAARPIAGWSTRSNDGVGGHHGPDGAATATATTPASVRPRPWPWAPTSRPIPACAALRTVPDPLPDASVGRAPWPAIALRSAPRRWRCRRPAGEHRHVRSLVGVERREASTGADGRWPLTSTRRRPRSDADRAWPRGVPAREPPWSAGATGVARMLKPRDRSGRDPRNPQLGDGADSSRPPEPLATGRVRQATGVSASPPVLAKARHSSE